MAKLDLTQEFGLKGRAHCQLKVDSGTMAYCYIRKNACTVFKKFFLERSATPIQPPETDLAFMLRAHRAKPEDVAAAEYRICVLRDPVKRCASLFKNKFIQRNGNVGVFKNYREVTGEAPELATFDDFIEKYLATGLNLLDPHTRTQKSHLLPIEYNHAFLMQDVYQGMVPIIGETLAGQYFAKPKNSSDGETRYDSPVGDQPSTVLRRIFLEEQKSPSDAALLSPERVKKIEALYKDDIELIQRLALDAT